MIRVIRGKKSLPANNANIAKKKGFKTQGFFMLLSVIQTVNSLFFVNVVCEALHVTILRIDN